MIVHPHSVLRKRIRVMMQLTVILNKNTELDSGPLVLMQKAFLISMCDLQFPSTSKPHTHTTSLAILL